MFFEDYKSIHCVGIGGIGLSGLARICAAKGMKVTGSDSTASHITDQLNEEGILTHIGHDADHLQKNCDLLVYSEAIPMSNVEILAAKDMGIPTMTYFQALGLLTDSYKLIAISGTHGKTTTTAMLSLILTEAGLDPTVLVGTNLKEFNGRNVRIGESDLFVVEACEYRNNFRHLNPHLFGVINMDLDHLDSYSNEGEYQMAFHDLADKSEETIWPGEFEVYDGEVGVPGEHNKIDAGLAAHCARELGASEEAIGSALRKFTGTWRRYELKGEFKGAKIYDDYAHHPVEIKAVLKTAREQYPDKVIKVVYQPHQYSRTKAFFSEFAESFKDANEVIVPDIYECRDSEEDKTVSAEGLAHAINESGTPARFGDGLENTLSILRKEVENDEVVFIMGAGTVTWIAEELVKS